ncbi:hypothetical protein [Pleurocapsa sp. PCC 7319]|uniref:hypothetical protein n=1 Tax=Pleurocapsa sp. PCC 7319 TaxID=118161 RepID=UPI00035C1A3B|nr:hypothetical protein [Pleurocapsa sp. PCC 7319]
MLYQDLADHFAPIKSITSSYLQQNVIKKAITLDNYLVDKLGNSISTYLNSWLAQHPMIEWLVSHPVISLITGLIVAILVTRLLVTIYRAIANTIDRMWLWILRSPLLLVKFLIGWEAKSKSSSSNTTITNYEVISDSDQLAAIVARLDKIQQQQEQILQDIAQLKQKSQKSLAISPQQIKLPAAQVISNQK